MNGSIRLRQKLFSNQTEAAAKYCFEVFEYLQNIEIVKNNFWIFLDHIVAIWLKYGWNVFFNNNYAFERNKRLLMLLMLFDWKDPSRIPKKKYVSFIWSQTFTLIIGRSDLYYNLHHNYREIKCKNKNQKQPPRRILQQLLWNLNKML